MKGAKKYLLTWAFISFVSLHLLLFFVLKKEKIDSILKRDKATFPELKAEEPFYPRLEAYIADHFPAKNSYVAQSNYLTKGILGAANAKSQVLWGSQHWLFYNATINDDRGLNEAYGYRAFTKAELAKIAQNIQTIRNWCERHQIAFELLLCPNKHSVYPEYLPMPYAQTAQQSQLDQIYDAVPQLIPLKKRLLHAKNQRFDLYYRQDTHWNKLGAYLAVKALQEKLQSSFHFLQPFAAQPFFDKHHKEMDLANMFGLNGCLPYRNVGLLYTKKPKKKIPHLVIVHDSFLNNMLPSLKHLFTKVSPKFIFNEGLLSPEILLREKADVFVIELVERYKTALIGDLHPDYYK